MKIKKFLASFLTLSFVSLFVAPQGLMAQSAKTKTTTKKAKAVTTTVAKSTLAANTPIVINLADTVSTENVTLGTTVQFTVANDVKDASGNVLVRTGAPVSAVVSSATSKARIGKSGEVTVENFSATAVDGTIIPLSGSVSEKAQAKKKLSITLSIFVCPLFLLMKGQDAIIPAGTQQTVYTTSDISIKPAKI